MGLEAALGLRLSVGSQQRAHFSLPLVASRSRKAVCCANPDPEQHGHEEARLRVEISPSVLRSLQPPDPSCSSITPGESLVERNLRKQAAAKQKQSTAALGQGDDRLSPPEEPACSSSTSPLGEQGFLPGIGEIKDYSRYAISNACPISTVFWQESPPGFSMESFHGIEFYVVCLFFSLFSSPDNIREAAYRSWDLQASNMFPDNGEKGLLKDFEKILAALTKILVALTEDSTFLQGALPRFGTFWSHQSWTKRVKSGKAQGLALVSILTGSVYVLATVMESARVMEIAPDLKEKLEDKSASLNKAVAQLHGPVLDPEGVWQKALKGSCFVLDGSAHLYNYSLIFPCTVSSSGGQLEFGSMLEEVQECLDSEFQGHDLVALLRRSSDRQGKFFILIAPWYWILPIESQQFARLAGFSSLLSCLAMSQFASAGYGLGFAWEQYGVSLGWAAIISSMFNMSFPVLCPLPSLGAIKKVSFDYGNLPSRKSLIIAILKNYRAPLAVSILLLACGFTFWGPYLFNAASVIDFGGYILVPSDIFAYSGLLTKLLQTVSVTLFEAEDGGAKLAVSPFALAGLLGLNFTVLSLFPGLGSEGSYLLQSLLRSRKLANKVTYVCTVMLTLSLWAQNPFLGLAWLVLSFMPGEQVFVKDDVSDPDLLTRLAGSVLVAGALACFVPFPQL